MPPTSSPAAQAQTLWRHFAASPPNGSFIHPAIHLSASAAAGLGLSVSAAVPAHTALLRLPRSCHLRPDSSAAIASTLPVDDPFLALCLTLHYERAMGDASPHAQHVAALPAHFDQPLAWDAVQLRHLHDTSLAVRPPLVELEADWVLHVRPYLRAHHAYPHIEPGDHQWAVCCVLSRGFRDRDGQPCMVPLLDYCNTTVATAGAGGASGPSCYIGWEESGSVVLLSGAAGLAVGEEVTIAYGEERGNASLLQRYGFVVAGNAEDTVDLDVERLARTADDMVHFAKPTPGTKRGRAGQAQDEDDEEDDGASYRYMEYVDQLPEEFISISMPPPYVSATVTPPIPLRLLKIAAALLNYYPWQELIEHSDVKPFAQSLPLRLDGEGRREEAEEAEEENGGQWVTSAELELTLEEELEVIELVWPMCLEMSQEREFSERLSRDSEEDRTRWRLAGVLRASERRILAAHADNCKRRVAHLLGNETGARDDTRQAERKAEEDEKAAPLSRPSGSTSDTAASSMPSPSGAASSGGPFQLPTRPALTFSLPPLPGVQYHVEASAAQTALLESHPFLLDTARHPSVLEAQGGRSSRYTCNACGRDTTGAHFSAGHRAGYALHPACVTAGAVALGREQASKRKREETEEVEAARKRRETTSTGAARGPFHIFYEDAECPSTQLATEAELRAACKAELQSLREDEGRNGEYDDEDDRLDELDALSADQLVALVLRRTNEQEAERLKWREVIEGRRMG